MLTLIALSAALMQEPPAPPRPAPKGAPGSWCCRRTAPVSLDKDGDGQVSRKSSPRR
ncbi:MAG: hypothetical protein KL785_07230 [Brevundimonas sp.]|nr:hypothetical protein [Brevundimonas sp.]